MPRINPFENHATKYDDWYESGFGRHASQLEDKLMLELLKPKPGNTLLDIGCGTGRHLLLFNNLGLKVTGADTSCFMLDKAKEKVNEKSLICLSEEEPFPFEDKSFDLSIIFLTLEFCKDPIRILKEAERVTKSRIFIGFLNRFSLLTLQRRIKGIFKSSIYNQARFFSLSELYNILESHLEFKALSWKGVIFLPWLKFQFWQRLDLKLSFIKNPFCAFIGVLIKL
jgi:ubiquinone/menaquinone biosynthesis C-methylase UbiE